MKILTNLSDNKYSSISRGFSELSNFVRKQNNIELVGVNILHGENDNNEIRESKKIKLHLLFLPYEKITNPLSEDISSLDDFSNKYEIVTNSFRKVVKKEKPDAILLNGTYEIPWSLMNATKDLKIPTFVHYIGLLTKERHHKDRRIFTQMEKEFDNSRLKYIFPSNLAKKRLKRKFLGIRLAPL